MPQQIGEPLASFHIGLASRDGLAVRRIDQDDRMIGFQQVLHRSPVHAGRFHRHLPDAQPVEPVIQPYQVPRHGPKRAHFPSHRAIRCGDQRTGHHRPLMDVQPTAPHLHDWPGRSPSPSTAWSYQNRGGAWDDNTFPPRALRPPGQGNRHLRWTRPDQLAGGLTHRTILTAIALPRLLPEVCLIFTSICGRRCHVACCQPPITLHGRHSPYAARSEFKARRSPHVSVGAISGSAYGIRSCVYMHVHGGSLRCLNSAYPMTLRS